MGSFVICRAHIAANIIRMINSRRMRWLGHVTGVEEVRNVYNISVGNLVGKKQPMGSVNVFKWFLKKENARKWTRTDLLRALVNTVMILGSFTMAGIFLTMLDTVSFPKRTHNNKINIVVVGRIELS
jgi:hypothetical protein